MFIANTIKRNVSIASVTVCFVVFLCSFIFTILNEKRDQIRARAERTARTILKKANKQINQFQIFELPNISLKILNQSGLTDIQTRFLGLL